MHGVVDHGLEARHHREVARRQLLGVDREAVVDLGEHAVLLAEREVELLAEDLRVEQILHTDPDAQRLVGVRGPDAALGRPELVLAQVALGHPVELLVVRHDQVRVAGEPQEAGVDALGLEHVDLVDEHRRVDDHAVADDRRHPRVEDAARHELELEDLSVDHERVARVVAALVPDAHRRLLGEVVGDPTLALVAPLRADDHRAGHETLHLFGVTLGKW